MTTQGFLPCGQVKSAAWRRTSNCVAAARVLWGIALAMLPALYFLSCGPVLWLSVHGVLPQGLARGYYYPLERLGLQFPAFHDLFTWYLGVWVW